MKILYLHQYFNTPEMTGSTRSYEMAKRFVMQGHEVHLITSWREARANQAWFENNVDGIQVHWLPVEYSNHMSPIDRIKAFFKFAYKSARKAAELEADVIFATSTPLTIALPAVYAAKKQKIPMVFEVRDLWPDTPIAMGFLKNPVTRFLAKRLELFAYKNAESVVALSPGMKEGVIQTGFPADKVAVIPNSSDIDMFRVNKSLGDGYRSKYNWLRDNPLLIYTGTFGKVNGIEYAVDLAVELKKLDSDVIILLIGDGSELVKISEFAICSGVLNKNLFIEKPVPKKVIPSILSAASMTCSLVVDKPQLQANSANKFFDSLAAGRPIMINHGGWMHDLIRENGCGLAMWQKSISEVAMEIDEHLNDQVWLNKASEASIRLAKEFFDRDFLASQLIQVLEATVQGQPEKAESIAPGVYDESGRYAANI